MTPWVTLAEGVAPDGEQLDLRQRGHEYLIRAGGYDLMSSDDEGSARALAELGCAHLKPGTAGRVLVGGLGMGYTLRAALDATGPNIVVEVAELVPCVAQWNRTHLADLAGRPLEDPRAELRLCDVARCFSDRNRYQAILLDVDNGPDALAHDHNDGLYGTAGIDRAMGALAHGGVLATWSFSDDPGYTRRLECAGLSTVLHKVPASRRGRGRHHFVWVARKRAG